MVILPKTSFDAEASVQSVRILVREDPCPLAPKGSVFFMRDAHHKFIMSIGLTSGKMKRRAVMLDTVQAYIVSNWMR